MQTYTGHACTSCIFGNKSCNIFLMATLLFGELSTISLLHTKLWKCWGHCAGLTKCLKSRVKTCLVFV